MKIKWFTPFREKGTMSKSGNVRFKDISIDGLHPEREIMQVGGSCSIHSVHDTTSSENCKFNFMGQINFNVLL